jgi:hypothetical protein
MNEKRFDSLFHIFLKKDIFSKCRRIDRVQSLFTGLDDSSFPFPPDNIKYIVGKDGFRTWEISWDRFFIMFNRYLSEIHLFVKGETWREMETYKFDTVEELTDFLRENANRLTDCDS